MKKQKRTDQIIGIITKIFLPLIPVIMAAALLKGILAIVLMTGVLSTEATTYIVLNVMGDSVFYFLPVYLAYTTAQSIETNPFTAMMIAMVLLHPDLGTLFDGHSSVDYLGLPMLSVTYRSSILPVIMMVVIQKPMEGFLNKKVHDLVKAFVVPLILLVVLGSMTLLVLGPIGGVIGDLLAKGYEIVYKTSPFLAGGLLGGAIQPMVIFGFHWSFFLVGMNNIALYGTDTLIALLAPAVFAQVGAVLTVFMKTEDKKLKSICISAAISALFGVTEPAMFAVNIPLKKPMIGVVTGGAIGGAIVGLSNVHAVAFVFPSLATLPVFATPGFAVFLIGCIAGFLSAIIVTGVILKSDEAMLPRDSNQ